MTEQAIKRDPDGYYRIKGDRAKQLRSAADGIIDLAEALAAVGNPEESLQRKMRGQAEQLLIIADEIERRPEPGVFAQRIYDMLKDNFRASTTIILGSIYKNIEKILADPYAHLDTKQRETIRIETAAIMAAGNGSGNVDEGCMSCGDALTRISNWTITEMIEWADECNWPSRIKFDPRTGEPWQDD